MPVGTPPLSDLWRNNVLFRYRPGGNLDRFTYSRTSNAMYWSHAGVLTKGATSTLRTQWSDIDSDGVRETPSTVLEGARTQLVTDPENFGAWTADGTIGRTSGQADPFSGTAAYLLDSNAAAGDAIRQVVTFTGNGTKTLTWFVRGNTSGQTRVGIFDSTFGWRRRVEVIWTAGVPSLANTTGTGTLYPVEAVGTGSWYRLSIDADGVDAANTNQIYVFPDILGGLNSMYLFGINAWNAPFPSGYQGPSFGAAATDSLTVPVNWGPLQSCSVLARLARPAHADVSGTLGTNPQVFNIGSSAPRLLGYFASASRLIGGQIDTPTTDQTQTTSIPAGTSMYVLWQFKNLTTGGQVAVDSGAGLTAFSSAATAFASFGAQTLRIGGSGGDELYGSVLDLLIVRGLYTRAEMIGML